MPRVQHEYLQSRASRCLSLSSSLSSSLSVISLYLTVIEILMLISCISASENFNNGPYTKVFKLSLALVPEASTETKIFYKLEFESID